jgi:hypothetical protein
LPAAPTATTFEFFLVQKGDLNPGHGNHKSKTMGVQDFYTGFGRRLIKGDWQGIARAGKEWSGNESTTSN